MYKWGLYFEIGASEGASLSLREVQQLTLNGAIEVQEHIN
jgi:hypothetical protein